LTFGHALRIKAERRDLESGNASAKIGGLLLAPTIEKYESDNRDHA
jgi:hypothetical protein